MCKHAGLFVAEWNFSSQDGIAPTSLVCNPDRKESCMKIGILIGVIVAALLVGFSFVKEEAPSGSVKNNFGNNWAR